MNKKYTAQANFVTGHFNNTCNVALHEKMRDNPFAYTKLS